MSEYLGIKLILQSVKIQLSGCMVVDVDFSSIVLTASCSSCSQWNCLKRIGVLRSYKWGELCNGIKIVFWKNRYWLQLTYIEDIFFPWNTIKFYLHNSQRRHASCLFLTVQLTMPHAVFYLRAVVFVLNFSPIGQHISNITHYCFRLICILQLYK